VRDITKEVGVHLKGHEVQLGQSEGIDQINQQLCMMTIKYGKICREQGLMSHLVLTETMLSTSMKMKMMMTKTTLISKQWVSLSACEKTQKIDLITLLLVGEITF